MSPIKKEETHQLTTSPRYSPCPTPSMRILIRISKPCITIALLLACVTILRLAQHTHANAHRQQLSVAVSEASFDISIHEVHMDVPGFGTLGDSKQILSFYKCGDETMASDTIEILLLHGAKFTKDNWKESGILDSLCFIGNNNQLDRRTRVIAADLQVKADAVALQSAFKALTNGGFLSGEPIVIVTPSASGKSVVSLLESSVSVDATTNTLLEELLNAWVPVASGAVLSINDDNIFSSFKAKHIPVLAINGDKDRMGVKVTETLVAKVGATGIELEGTHPVYLDSPTKFVDTLIDFVYGFEKDSE